MKTAFMLLVIVISVVVSGCVTSAPTSTATLLPNLTGTWTGPMVGYDEGTGFTDYPYLRMSMVIEEQQGRLFSGHMRFNSNGTEWMTEIAGAIGRDNRTLTVTEKDGGYCFGEVLAPDEIELMYVQDGSPYSVALDFLNRVK